MALSRVDGYACVDTSFARWKSQQAACVSVLTARIQRSITSATFFGYRRYEELHNVYLRSLGNQNTDGGGS